MRIVSVLLMLVVLQGCAPGLSDTLRVDRVRNDEGATVDATWKPLKVRVQEFKDLRTRQAIGEINGRELSPSGDIPHSVQSAFEQQLKASGVRLALFDSPSIDGEISEWFVSVKPNFPKSTVESQASVRLTLYSPQSTVIYRASYSGTASAEGPLISEDKVEEVLALSMHEALAQALEDPQLLSKLGELSVPPTAQSTK